MVGKIHWMGTEMQLHRDWKASSSCRDLCPRKETSLGRCGHQEGDVPEDVVPREETFPSQCPQEADVFGKEMSLGTRCPRKGHIPR